MNKKRLNEPLKGPPVRATTREGVTPRLSQKHFILSKGTKDDCEPILQKASLAHKEGRLAEAEQGYLEALKRKPDWRPVLNALGTVYLDQSQRDKARKAFEKACQLRPPYVPACYNLARLKQQENDHQGAISLYRAILENRPDFGQAWNNLGMVYRETGDPDEALSCFQRAVTLAPHMAEAWNNLGVAQDELNRIQDASTSYRKAIEVRPDYASAHFNLGVSLQKLKHYKEAEDHYKKVIETKPDDEAARFMLQSLGTSQPPDAAPAEHVRRIFDRCAGTFERILIEELEYKTPRLLFDLVRPYLTEAMDILDLGCGTGLGSGLYRPFAKSLTGVDVSSKMLEKAAEKRTYDRLQVFDILKDWAFSQRFDVIFSSDVFVYFGNLDPIVRSAASFLVHGGILAFSVERLEDDPKDYRLFPTGRYAHSRIYVEECLRRHGFQSVEESKAAIRKESGNQVRGLLIVATKGNP